MDVTRILKLREFVGLLSSNYKPFPLILHFQLLVVFAPYRSIIELEVVVSTLAT